MKNFLRFITFLCIAVYALPSHAILSDKYTYKELVYFTSQDGTRIAGNLFVPKLNSENSQKKFPAIIFINSWAMEEHEYIVQAAKFAKDGYIVLSYSARGWGLSGGEAGIGTRGDMEDVTAAIDYLVANTPVDVKNIGSSGISYGAGTSLLALNHETRIKTAVAMSTFTNVEEHLYGGKTPRLTWGAYLVGSGYLLGNMEPILPKIYRYTLTHSNIELIKEWAFSRSPINNLDKINSKKKPVYIAQNFQDYMFWPNEIIRYYKAVKGPKRLDLSLGTHASAELKGLAGMDSYIWNNTHDWFDHYLKGVKNRIDEKAPVTMEVKNTKIREEFNYLGEGTHNKVYHLGPRGWFSKGKLSTYKNHKSRTNKIVSTLPSGATAGVPILAPFAESHLNLPILAWIPGLNRLSSAAFQTGYLDESMEIRGNIGLELNLTSTKPDFQIIAYLYDTSPGGLGKLITHGPATFINENKDTEMKIQFNLITTAYDVPGGNYLTLVLDTGDPAFGPASAAPFSIDLNFSRSKISRISIPIK